MAQHVHVPDPASVDVFTPYRSGAHWMADVSCKVCGASGSVEIDPTMIQWPEDD